MRHAAGSASQCGNAMAETLVTLLALTPFIAGIPLLGKQLDVKQKTYEAARYAVWERTLWRSDGASNAKAQADITLEARDRTLGSPSAGVITVAALHAGGITENLLWRDRERQRLLNYEGNDAPIGVTYAERQPPVAVGEWLVPGIAYGEGVLGAVESALGLQSLNLNRRAFVGATVAL